MVGRADGPYNSRSRGGEVDSGGGVGKEMGGPDGNFGPLHITLLQCDDRRGRKVAGIEEEEAVPTPPTPDDVEGRVCVWGCG